MGYFCTYLTQRSQAGKQSVRQLSDDVVVECQRPETGQSLERARLNVGQFRLVERQVAQRTHLREGWRRNERDRIAGQNQTFERSQTAEHLSTAKADLGGARGPCPPRCQTLCNMTLKQHNAGVHCNKKTPSMASNYAFHFHLTLNFRLWTLTNASASGGLRPPDSLAGLLSWTPLLNKWIIHSQQKKTINQDIKISSVRPGSINIELYVIVIRD